MGLGAFDGMPQHRHQFGRRNTAVYPFSGLFYIEIGGRGLPYRFLSVSGFEKRTISLEIRFDLPSVQVHLITGSMKIQLLTFP